MRYDLPQEEHMTEYLENENGKKDIRKEDANRAEMILGIISAERKDEAEYNKRLLQEKFRSLTLYLANGVAYVQKNNSLKFDTFYPSVAINSLQETINNTTNKKKYEIDDKEEFDIYINYQDLSEGFTKLVEESLQGLGLELKEYYVAKRKHNNAYTFIPVVHIKDIDKFLIFMDSVSKNSLKKHPEQKPVLEDILEELEKQMMDKESRKIHARIDELQTNIKRLDLEQGTFHRRSIFYAAKHKCIQELKQLFDLGFNLDIRPSQNESLELPTFLREINESIQTYSKKNASKLRTEFSTYGTKVSLALSTIRMLKEKKALFQQAQKELMEGIYIVLRSLVNNKKIDPEEKQSYIEIINEHLYKISTM